MDIEEDCLALKKTVGLLKKIMGHRGRFWDLKEDYVTLKKIVGAVKKIVGP